MAVAARGQAGAAHLRSACSGSSWLLRAFLCIVVLVFFFLFADGIGDVLSHLRKQVEILFNSRYGKMVINMCSSCQVLVLSPTISKPAAE